MGALKIKKLLANSSVLFIMALAMIAPVAITAPETASADSPPAYNYTKSFDTTNGNAISIATATDTAGDVFVAGFCNGTVVFDGPGGTDSINTGSGNSTLFVTKYGPGGVYDWTKISDATATSSAAVAQSIAIDTSGNLFLAGYFYGTVIFDGPGGTDSSATAPYTTGYLTKINANGGYGWTKAFDTSAGNDSGIASLAIDKSGNLYATGLFAGTTIFDGVGGTDSVTSANGSLFLTKYNPNGSYGWTKISDTSGGSGYSAATGVAVDATGSIYVTATFQDAVIFDGPGGTDSVTSANGSASLTKYNPNGSYGWTRYFDTTGGNNVFSGGVTVDPAGGIYILTGYGGTVIFDGPGGTDSHTVANGNFDGAITKYSSTGGYGWTKTFDATFGNAVYGDGSTWGITTDTKGNIYAASYFTGTVVFDGAGGTDSLTAANVDSFLTSFRAFVPPPIVASHTDAGSDSKKVVSLLTRTASGTANPLLANADSSQAITPAETTAPAPTKESAGQHRRTASSSLTSKVVGIGAILAVIVAGYIILKRRLR